eukprot:CAMPEP_0168536144 /NCGR_PEP_ID=MMETSP0405-20121227/19306_1 /TAXON_ID=498012 /ORGANISM="Trichosphaerium sp, Strain Am-I-7 wt" /LENGTH=648 /DNA_ID=CAMNT_0008563957 /DNA_START=13 /DNA_END=1959 /DNA_ORIENTATION=+
METGVVNLVLDFLKAHNLQNAHKALTEEIEVCPIPSNTRKTSKLERLLNGAQNASAEKDNSIPHPLPRPLAAAKNGTLGGGGQPSSLPPITEGPLANAINRTKDIDKNLSKSYDAPASYLTKLAQRRSRVSSQRNRNTDATATQPIFGSQPNRPRSRTSSIGEHARRPLFKKRGSVEITSVNTIVTDGRSEASVTSASDISEEETDGYSRAEAPDHVKLISAGADDASDTSRTSDDDSEYSGRASASSTRTPGSRTPGMFTLELDSIDIDNKPLNGNVDDPYADFNLVHPPDAGPFKFFDLKVVYQKKKTGFEETRDFPIRTHDYIGGRYEIISFLGAAAFSRAVKCLDHKTGKDVCIKIITNNKDFFDQSLDEIKLLSYVNASGDPDEYNVLNMFDYFYFKEHLFIVCELLGKNLYDFYSQNREAGGDLYFTIPRLQRVAKQIIKALTFVHSLGLIHCDLKPENILIKNAAQCEVKVIDFGSSCFTTDHLSSYVQSRSYRAPEVILGCSYDARIDIWSLGCILAELFTGQVLFQNTSVPTLLARLIGILGPIGPEMMSKGKLVHKFFTANNRVYEFVEGSNTIQILKPKQTSLARRLGNPDDEEFLDFMSKLLRIDARERPSSSDALKHSWFEKKYPFELYIPDSSS